MRQKGGTGEETFMWGGGHSKGHKRPMEHLRRLEIALWQMMVMITHQSSSHQLQF